jgi:hypothetical protein
MRLIVRRTLERIEKKKGKLYNENYLAERLLLRERSGYFPSSAPSQCSQQNP